MNKQSSLKNRIIEARQETFDRLEFDQFKIAIQTELDSVWTGIEGRLIENAKNLDPCAYIDIHSTVEKMCDAIGGARSFGLGLYDEIFPIIYSYLTNKLNLEGLTWYPWDEGVELIKRRRSSQGRVWKNDKNALMVVLDEGISSKRK